MQKRLLYKAKHEGRIAQQPTYTPPNVNKPRTYCTTASARSQGVHDRQRTTLYNAVGDGDGKHDKHRGRDHTWIQTQNLSQFNTRQPNHLVGPTTSRWTFFVDPCQRKLRICGRRSVGQPSIARSQVITHACKRITRTMGCPQEFGSVSIYL